MTFESIRNFIKTNREFIKHSKYFFVLLLIPFSILFFTTQGSVHSGHLEGKDYRYDGQVYHAHPQGNGTMVFKNGNVYKGHFTDGNFDGQGRLTNQSAKWTYQGQFTKGQPNGSGKMKLHNGKTKPVKFKMGVMVK